MMMPPYNVDDAHYDAQAWKRESDAQENSLSNEMKFKPDYIAAKVAQNQVKLQNNIRKYNM